MSKSVNINISRDDVEWMMQELDFIKESAIGHANPQDPTMEEWGPVFGIADDIFRMLDGYVVEVDK